MLDTLASSDYFRPRAWRGSIAAMALMTAAWSAAQAAPATWVLSAGEWAVPRQAETILTMQPVVAAVRALLAQPQAELSILHPAGEEGGLWGAELRAWLVALGVEAQRIHVQPAASEVNRVSLSVSAVPAAAAKAGRAAP